jgi:hypothetical protein
MALFLSEYQTGALPVIVLHSGPRKRSRTGPQPISESFDAYEPF